MASSVIVNPKQDTACLRFGAGFRTDRFRIVFLLSDAGRFQAPVKSVNSPGAVLYNRPSAGPNKLPCSLQHSAQVKDCSVLDLTANIDSSIES